MLEQLRLHLSPLTRRRFAPLRSHRRGEGSLRLLLLPFGGNRRLRAYFIY